MALGTSVAVAASCRSRTPWVLAGACVAFSAGGAVLAVRAWDGAWRSPLSVEFDTVAGNDDVVSGVLTGVLRADARVGAEVVSLSVSATAFEPQARGRGRAETALPGGSARSVHGGVQLSVAGPLAVARAEQWRAGRIVRAPVRLRHPVTHRNPGGLDEARTLARRGVALVGTAKSGALVDVIARGSRVSEAAGAARAFVRRVITAHVGRWDATAAGIVTAILIGDRAGLTMDVERSLQEAGTYHVIAISGGNIAILAAVTLVLFRWTGLLGRSAMLTAIVLFLAYGRVVDGGASVDRAVVVAVLYFAARALDHHLHPLQGLLLAAGGLVVVDPLAVCDPGFLLSFGATLGILAVSPLVPRSAARPLVQAVIGMLVASAAAEAALLPIVAFVFGRITVAGLALNFVAIPLMAIVQVAGMVLIPMSVVWSSAADAVGWMTATCASALVGSASLVDWVPSLAWRVARPSAWVIATYYGSLVASVAVWRCGFFQVSAARRIFRATTVVAGMAAVWIAFEPWTVLDAGADGRLRVTFLDVGQGDASLVRFPGGATLLVDAGGAPSGAYDVGDRVVVPALRYQGVRRLDTVVLTHGDTDHVGGARTVVGDLRPFDVWEGVPVPRLTVLRDLRSIAAQAGIRWTQVQRADVTTIDGVEVRVHHPVPPDWERQDPRNDDSIVLELRWREVSIVLPGDVGWQVENELVDAFQPAPLRVLKAAHHGSATSSGQRFVERLRPVVAVISAGRGNSFGHPAAAVVKRFEAIGTSVYRTDQDGAVSVTTDGHDLEIRTISGRSAYWSGSPRKHESTKGLDD